MTLAPRSISLLGDFESRSVAQIVGIGFERQAQQADRAALQDLQLAQEPVHHPLPLAPVHLAGGLDDGHFQTVFGRRRHQRGSILAEAGTTPADAGLQESGADARIQADALWPPG